MDHCKYHPLAPATYYCTHCQVMACDECSDDSSNRADAECFLCHKSLRSLGAVNSAEPFWRRLQQSFRYPMHPQAATMIGIVSLLTTLCSLIPSVFIFLPLLMLSGAMMKYAFTCLESTSSGNLTAPNIGQAFGEGLSLLIKLMAIFILIGASITATIYIFGVTLGMIIGLLFIVSLPAILINFSINEDIIEALNPINASRLMLSIGIPYLLLLVFIGIMLVSVGAISQFIGDSHSLITTTLQSIVSNYYTIVIFHIMGYMIFQYQDRLGFIAREKKQDNSNSRTEIEKSLAGIEVHIKEGLFQKAIVMFDNLLKQHPTNKKAHEKCFDFLCAIKESEKIKPFSCLYLKYIIDNQQNYLLLTTYKRTLHIAPLYIPRKASVRFILAKALNDSGDFKTAIKLINGLHKQHPKYSKLVDAYILMAECLQNLPNMQEKVKQCYRLVEHLKKGPAVASVTQEETPRFKLAPLDQ
ncbi:MAG: tetratricopeptide (TPR) repeat protein [Candidatus Endobugula sp.]|jgi:tetratricopeptide (TPR) repeat protein